MMKRRLVGHNEAARHPLRQMLPPPQMTHAVIAPRPTSWWRSEDTHLFMLSFSAFFVSITSFIA
jgi:hypothetical protein